MNLLDAYLMLRTSRTVEHVGLDGGSIVQRLVLVKTRSVSLVVSGCVSRAIADTDP